MTDKFSDPRPGAHKVTLRPKPVARQLLAELVEEGRLVPAHVEGWKNPAYLHAEARVPRAIEARGLVTPFDSLVWDRRRLHRLFGMKYSIEIYTPVRKRIYGYYVCPFLLGDTLVARCDLKADRARKTLVVQGAFLERGQNAGRVAPELARELNSLRTWLQLDAIEIAGRGNLSAKLRRVISARRL